MAAAGHSTPETADLLGRERETPSLSTGWLLTLPQTRGFVARRCPAPNASAKFSLRNDARPRRKHEIFVAERYPSPNANTRFRCGTSIANRRRRSCERLHRIPCSNPSQKCPESKPGQSPSQKRSVETQSEVPAKAPGKRGRQKTSQWGSLQIVEPELAENATMGPAMTESRAPMQEQ